MSQQQRWECDICHKTFARASNLRSHKRTQHGLGGDVFHYECPECGQQFTNKSNCTRHRQRHIREGTYRPDLQPIEHLRKLDKEFLESTRNVAARPAKSLNPKSRSSAKRRDPRTKKNVAAALASRAAPAAPLMPVWRQPAPSEPVFPGQLVDTDAILKQFTSSLLVLPISSTPAQTKADASPAPAFPSEPNEFMSQLFQIAAHTIGQTEFPNVAPTVPVAQAMPDLLAPPVMSADWGSEAGSDMLSSEIDESDDDSPNLPEPDLLSSEASNSTFFEDTFPFVQPTTAVGQ